MIFKKIKNIFLVIFISGLTLLLTGCKLILLDPKGIIAADEKQIMIISALLMLIVVIPVIILTLYFAWRYRAGNTKAKYSPDWDHSTTLEIIWWSIPCIIIAILASITWTSSHKLDPFRSIGESDKTITIQVIALEWKWLFIYPNQHIATVNYIQIPVGTPVRFLISAEGPMNSFLIPQLAGQIYAMAGMQSKLHLIADKIGVYQGMSANFSGEGFSDMNFNVNVSSQEQFDTWVKQVASSPENLTTLAYNKLIQPSINNSVKYFSSVTNGIFDTVVMKSMMPMSMPIDKTISASSLK